jgi:hypothetical protein
MHPAETGLLIPSDKRAGSDNQSLVGSRLHRTKSRPGSQIASGWPTHRALADRTCGAILSALETVGGALKRLLFLWVAFALAGMLRAQTSTAVLVLRGGTVVDVASGKEIPDTVIVIRGERIEQIGAANAGGIPEGAQIIEARGRWIVPGLIDSHAHAASAEETPLDLYLANGVTTIRNPGRNTTVLRLTRDKLLRGEIRGPRLFFSGHILDGMPPVGTSGLLVDTPERARSAVNFLADQGVDFVKVYNNVKEPELKVIIETAKERGLPVAGHVPRTLTMTRAIELGMTRLEHIRITGKEMLSAEEAAAIDPLPVGKREPMLWQRFDLQSEKMRALVQLLAKSRVFLDPTLVVDEIFRSLDKGSGRKRSQQPVLAQVRRGGGAGVLEQGHLRDAARTDPRGARSFPERTEVRRNVW